MRLSQELLVGVQASSTLFAAALGRVETAQIAAEF